MGEALTKEDVRRIKLQAQLNAEFRRVLAKKYRAECRKTGEEPTLEGMIEYAERFALVRNTDINRYMMFEKYPEAMYHTNGCRSKAVAYLEDVIPVSDRKIFGWLTNFRARYMKYRHGR